MERLPKIWEGEASQEYQNFYQTNAQDILLLAETIMGCANILNETALSYSKVDAKAADVIKSKLSRK
jgi:uncharacterized protein YukE